MPQEDRLKREIDQMAKVLAAILSKLLGLKSDTEAAEALVYSNETLKEALNLNIDDICAIEPEELLLTLTGKMRLTQPAMDALANILYQSALMAEDNNAPARAFALFLRSQKIFGYLISVSATYSFDWYYKMGDIESRLG